MQDTNYAMQSLKFLFILLFLGFSSFCYCQSNDLDTLRKYSYEELENIFYSYKDGNQVENSKIIAQYYLQKARKEQKDKKYLAEGYVLNQYNQDLPVALRYIDSLGMISKNFRDDDRYPARIYLLKGLLYNQFDNETAALENFVTALKYAKEKNNKRQIAIAGLQIAYLNGYIGKHEETVKVLEYYYTHQDFLTEQDIEHIQINLADAYLDIHKYEKALKLIQKGIKQTSKNNEELKYNRYLILLGRYNLKIKKYSIAIQNLENCKKYFLKNNLDFDANYSMLYLGHSYAEFQNKEKALENFIKIDSIIQKTNNTFPELRYTYTYIIDYYREKKDKEKQLYYIDRFLTVDETLNTQFKYISRELPRKYDTPKLLLEKEEIISKLKKRRYLSYITIGLLCSMVIILTFLFVKAKRKEKEYKKNAQDLIKAVNDKSYSSEKTFENKVTDNQEVFDPEKNKISDDIVKNILRGLKIFEEKEQYLKNGITLNSLAKKLKTNSTYLSQVVNTYKEKTFASYLSDLRIDYALIRLVNDKTFRSYKLSVIAEELGYNNEQAFSKAFKRRTGTTLSIYLKEIEGNSN